jgi:hypothetical protein
MKANTLIFAFSQPHLTWDLPFLRFLISFFQILPQIATFCLIVLNLVLAAMTVITSYKHIGLLGSIGLCICSIVMLKLGAYDLNNMTRISAALKRWISNTFA